MRVRPPTEVARLAETPHGESACLGATLPATVTIVVIDWWIWCACCLTCPPLTLWNNNSHGNCIRPVAKCERSQVCAVNIKCTLHLKVLCYHSTRIRQLFSEYFPLKYRCTCHSCSSMCEFLSCYRQRQIPSVKGWVWVFFYVNNYSVSVINNQAGAQVWSHHQLYTCITWHSIHPVPRLIRCSQRHKTHHNDTQTIGNRNNKADFMSY